MDKLVHILFLDLETSGLPERISFDVYYDYKQIDKYSKCRVVQLAARLYSCKESEYKLISTHDYIIKPDDFKIANESIHGISQNMALQTGISFQEVIKDMKNVIEKADILCAHNLAFDKNVLLSELYRNKTLDDVSHIIEKIVNMSSFCTMKSGSYVTKIKRGANYKSPKLVELHNFLFGEDIENAHDAQADTNALAKCFFEMLKKRYIYIIGDIVCLLV